MEEFTANKTQCPPFRSSQKASPHPFETGPCPLSLAEGKPYTEVGRAGHVILACRWEPRVLESWRRFRACSLRWQRRSKGWGFRAQGCCWVRLSPSLPGCLLGRTRSLLPPLQEKPLSQGHSGKRKLSGSKTCSKQAPEGQRDVCQPGLLRQMQSQQNERQVRSPLSQDPSFAVSLITPTPPS